MLGFDNLLYISLESKRAPQDEQPRVRRIGILIAIVLRIALLFVLVSVIKYFEQPILTLKWTALATAEFNIHSLIVLAGGVFILYTATKEILHMMSLEEEAQEKKELVVVEGFFDALHIWQAGFKNVVALMGSELYPAQTHLLQAALGTSGRVTLMLDGDVAGTECPRTYARDRKRVRARLLCAGTDEKPRGDSGA